MADEGYTSYQGGNIPMTNEPFESENPKIDSGDVEPEVNYEAMARLGFIRKVYGILVVQLLITTGFVCFSFIPAIRNSMTIDYSGISMIMVWVCCAIVLITSIILACCQKVARTVPTNYILLGIFTLAESYCLMFISCVYDPKMVLIALGGTALITISLTIYACTTKTDFTVCGGLLFALICVMIISGIIIPFFWNSYAWNIVYCSLGLLLYSIYLIYDTQLILGKFGNEFQIDDYIIAALNIYIDIIQIFLYLLRILGRSS